jgi:hypothetical protein
MRKFCAVMVTLLTAIAALAIDVRAVGGTVYVNLAPVMNLGTPKRATEVADAFRKAPSLTPVSAQSLGDDARLTAGKLALRVTAADGRAAEKTAIQLANEWASRLKDALKLPALLVPSRSLQVGPGSEQFFSIQGTEAGNVTVSTSNPKVAVVTRTALGMRVRGIQQGSTTVKIRGASSLLSALVQVLPAAARFPQSISATVVGEPSSVDTIINAIKTNAQMQMKMAAGADVDVVEAKITPLAQGASTTVQAKVRVSAPNAVATEGLITVKVTNLSVAQRREGELWYCNYPENIMGPGNLFAAELKEKTASRMLYHHSNVTSDPMVVQVVATNIYDVPARVVIIPGDGAPNKDPVRVGLEAGERFVRNWMTGSGEVITIPPRSSVPIAMRRLAPAETMSGLCYLRILPGGPGKVLVRTDAVDPKFMDAGWLAAANIATPWSKAGARKIGTSYQLPQLSQHIYEEPFKQLDSTYQVGGRFAFVWVGQAPINGENQLDGNFGVMYTVKAHLENPTDRPVEIEVVFEASAGYSGAVFVVNSQFQKAPLLQSKAEYVVRKITVAAGASQDMTIMTVPLSGSSYPALLTIRPTGTAMK